MRCLIRLDNSWPLIGPPLACGALLLLLGGGSALANSGDRCKPCHAQIVRAYGSTGMGRSLYRPNASNTIEDYASRSTFCHQVSDTCFTMIVRDGVYYQRRFQRDSAGREINAEEKSIDYVLGSANHARTYLHLTARNTLQELPLGWYSEDGGHWGMNPGYDRPDQPGSLRAISYECIFCHDAYPAIPAGHQKWRAEPVFTLPLPEGIDCDRCHGPAEQHISAASMGRATPAEIRRTIVNPSRLTPELQMNICMQCHLETTSAQFPHSVRRFEHGPFSYRPGEPLGNFRLFFEPVQNDSFEIAHAAYRFRKSACF